MAGKENRRQRPIARRCTALIGLALLLASCASSGRPLTDDEKIVRATLALLASDGREVCTDDHTKNQALAVYREMMLAPGPARDDLHWYPPSPLRPDMRVPTKQIGDAQREGESVRITQPNVRNDPLPTLDQGPLDAAARHLALPLHENGAGLAIGSGWTPQRVHARWWPLNRLRGDCAPLFIVSDPVRDGDLAFVSARADHWGTLYALKPRGKDWAPVAEWSRWLY